MIPLFRLGNHKNKELFTKVFHEVLDKETWTLGSYTKEFEDLFCERFGHKYGIAVSNGTMGIQLILNCLQTTEVFVSDTTFVGVWSAIANARLTEEVVILMAKNNDFDILNNQWIEALNISSGKSALAIITHLYGSRSAAAINSLRSLYPDILFMEDMSQAHGLKHSPSSHVQVYSLYPTKNLGALGEMGIITTDDKNLHDLLKTCRFYGYNEQKTSVLSTGSNYKADELQAAFLSAKLKNGIFDAELKARIDNARFYLDNIKNPFVTIPEFSEDCVFHLFPIWVEDRARFTSHMKSRGISTGSHYPYSVQTMTHDIQHNTSEWNDGVVTIPFGPYHTLEELAKVAKEINDYV